jgi:hypothetical protein
MEANSYQNLDLAWENANGNFNNITVWANNSKEHTIECLVKPGYFDPCAFLSSFAWCIRRLIPHWSLDRLATIELVYLGSVLSSSTPFVWLINQWLNEPAIILNETKARCMTERYYTETSKRSKRDKPVGGQISRHQTLLTEWPGGVGLSNTSFTNESVSNHLSFMRQIDHILLALGDPLSAMDGEKALAGLKSIPNLGNLCVLKFMPLCCIVGLLDTTKCFTDALYGELPIDKPHTKELANLGCRTQQQQQKFVQGLNEWLGVPREYFFFGDHVMCLTEGWLGSDKKKREIFFPEQTLYRFASDTAARIVRVESKLYGKKEWEPCHPIIFQWT